MLGASVMAASEECSYNAAVIFGVTGLVGRELAKKLVSKPCWKVYGVARYPEVISTIEAPAYHFISCDLLNSQETEKKLSGLRDVTHVFWVTWASHFPLDTQECCEQNKAMFCNALNALVPTSKALKHISLQTGMKHYVSLRGPFDEKEEKIYDEEWPRPVNGGYNFYHVLEDLLVEKLNAVRVCWSVHRPGLVLGSSVRSFYNFIGSLCAYGTICKHLNRPFVFGGIRECWEEAYIDVSDAKLVAEQQIWAATNKEIASPVGQAFNAINGPRFTWKEIWPVLGQKFGVRVHLDMFNHSFLFSMSMKNMNEVWREIVREKGLIQTELENIANWEFLDALFRCPVKMLGSRDKVDRLGFDQRCQPSDSFLYWIDCMRRDRLIP